MYKKLMLTMMAGLALALVVLPASASLTPISWGFPQVTEDHSLTAFQRQTSAATDNEAAAVAFPTTTGGLDGVLGSAFPAIAQTGLLSNAAESLAFQNEAYNYRFSYPFISIGGAPVPSMGFL